MLVDSLDSIDMRVVGCYVEYEGRILLLKRHPDKPYGNLWGIPTGKAAPGEQLLYAMDRELFEETGQFATLNQHRTHYVIHGTTRFSYSVYSCSFATPLITLNTKEHTAYRWVLPKDLYTMDLVEDLLECTRHQYPGLQTTRTAN